MASLSRGPALELSFAGRAITAYEGETVAAALLAAGVRRFRTSAGGEPRGPYCGIGVCFDCVVEIDGQPGLRACQTAVRPGMRVVAEEAFGHWPVEP